MRISATRSLAMTASFRRSSGRRDDGAPPQAKLSFILTRPLGATLGDILTKTREQGGLDLGTIGSSIVLAVFLVACIFFLTRNRSQGKMQQISDARCQSGGG